MRISDWSSDVCSSDLDLPALLARLAKQGRKVGAVVIDRRGVQMRAIRNTADDSVTLFRPAPAGHLPAFQATGRNKLAINESRQTGLPSDLPAQREPICRPAVQGARQSSD